MRGLGTLQAFYNKRASDFLAIQHAFMQTCVQKFGNAYLFGTFVNKSRKGDADIVIKFIQGKKVAGAIKGLVNTKGLCLECAKFLQIMLVPALVYGDGTLL